MKPGVIHIDFSPKYEPGDPPPVDPHDYLGWHAWADVQHKAGLRQARCGKCSRWRYPQEMSERTISGVVNEQAVFMPLCKACDAEVPNG